MLASLTSLQKFQNMSPNVLSPYKHNLPLMFPTFLLVRPTPCSSPQSRRALRSSSQADFVVTQSLRNLETLQLNGVSWQTSVVNLHYRSSN